MIRLLKFKEQSKRKKNHAGKTDVEPLTTWLDYYIGLLDYYIGLLLNIMSDEQIGRRCKTEGKKESPLISLWNICTNAVPAPWKWGTTFSYKSLSQVHTMWMVHCKYSEILSAVGQKEDEDSCVLWASLRHCTSLEHTDFQYFYGRKELSHCHA